MTLFDQVSGLLRGPAQGGAQSPVVNAVLEMLSQGGSGGLAGLVQTFREKGLGDVVSSWISTGPNLPISASQIQSALGNDTLRRLAEKAGLPLDAVSSQLAEVLPTAVDTLTPEGKVPVGGLLEQALGMLKGRRT
jgi:uncharacterized protein YidB (DUF937 family)